jgi:predicted exporter
MSVGRFAWVSTLIVLIGLGGYALAVTMTLRMDLSFFLPRTSTPTTQMILDRFRDGPASSIVLIGLSGAPESTLARASNSFAKAIAESDKFRFASNGAPPSLAELGDLVAYRYLLNPPINSDDFGATGLHRKLSEALRLLSTTLGSQLKVLLPADPTLRIMDIARYLHGSADVHRIDGVWFTPDGKTALLVAQTKAAPFDYAAQSLVVEWLRQTLDELRGKDDLKLDVTGPSIFAVQAHDVISSEAQWLNIIAFLAVAILIVIVFRSFYMILPLMLPLIAGILLGAAATQVIFGYVHGTSLAFGSTLIGVAVDYPIHLAVHAARTGDAKRTIRNIWKTLQLSALTTIVAFGALVFSNFPGLSQLGIIAVVGILTAALMTRWLIPLMLPDQSRYRLPLLRLPEAGARSRKAAGLVLTAGVIAAVLALASRGDSLWQHDLAGLSPIDRVEQQRDGYFRAALGVPDVRRLLVVDGASAEDILTRSESVALDLDRLVRDGTLGGFDMAAKYLPSARSQRERQTKLPTSDVLAAALNDALVGLPFNSKTFDPFLRDVEVARTAPPLTVDRLRASPFGAKLDTLIFEKSGAWVGLIALAAIKDDNGLGNLAQKASAPWLHYVDLKATSYEIAENYRREALFWLGGGIVVAVIVLLYGLRRIRSVLGVALPVLGAIVLTAGILVSWGASLSIFHLIGLLLVGGLGMDYGLFFNRRGDDAEDGHVTFTAVALCCLTTVAVFGILAASALPVLNNIGVTVAIGVSLAFVLCYLLRSQPDMA